MSDYAAYELFLWSNNFMWLPSCFQHSFTCLKKTWKGLKFNFYWFTKLIEFYTDNVSQLVFQVLFISKHMSVAIFKLTKKWLTAVIVKIGLLLTTFCVTTIDMLLKILPLPSYSLHSCKSFPTKKQRKIKYGTNMLKRASIFTFVLFFLRQFLVNSASFDFDLNSN